MPNGSAGRDWFIQILAQIPKTPYRKSRQGVDVFGSPARTRTTDKVINSHLLYQLSYWGIALELKILFNRPAACQALRFSAENRLLPCPDRLPSGQRQLPLNQWPSIIIPPAFKPDPARARLDEPDRERLLWIQWRQKFRRWHSHQLFIWFPVHQRLNHAIENNHTWHHRMIGKVAG